MTIAEALYAYLSTQAGLTALIGTRLYPVTIPQLEPGAALEPTIIYRLIGRNDQTQLNGVFSIASTKWRFACLAEGYDLSHQVAETLIVLLNCFKGQMGGVNGVRIEASQLEDAFDDPEMELGVYGVAVDFAIQFSQ
jgi:hypothetical protein